MADIDVPKILQGYDLDNITIATVCSHTSLQIFHGARKEGFKTLGITVGENRAKYMDAFPRAKPDEIIQLESYDQILGMTEELRERNTIVVPHGSLVEYLTPAKFVQMEVPTFGNRAVLAWESDRAKQREWLESAGLVMPREIKDPKTIDEPVLVKYSGARGGRGFFIARNYRDFKANIEMGKQYTIQEYILGTRYYLHYFYTPLQQHAYNLSKGSLEMLSMDRRDESNIDEMYKLGSQEELKEQNLFPSFVVTGNVPVVIRESLLPKVIDMGAQVVERSIELFGGMIGSFCLETVVTDKLEFRTFEISARIVAGTNPFITGSPYADFIYDDMSSGRRIAMEIKMAREMDRLNEVLS